MNIFITKDACPYQCMTYLYLPCSNSAPMALMQGHVNEWHIIKTKKPYSKHMIENKQTNM